MTNDGTVRRMRVVLAILIVSACGRSSGDEPAPAPPQQQARPGHDDETHLATAIDDVFNQPPEQLSAGQRAEAVDAKALIGTWNVVHTVSAIDGVARPPSEPLMPGSWVFDADGTYHKRGGNELDGTYVFSGKRLAVSALGPVLDYTIDRLTPSELVVTLTIMEGMWNTTTLRRAP
jgi:hypothetical protein